MPGCMVGLKQSTITTGDLNSVFHR